MEYYLLIARSVTYAQRIQRVLSRSGISCSISRASRELTDLGCAYAIKVETKDFTIAMMILHRENLAPIQIYLRQHSGYREVLL